MIDICIDLQPEEDVEEAVTAAVECLCGVELDTLHSHISHSWGLTGVYAPTMFQPCKHMLPFLIQNTLIGENSVLGQLLSCEPVMLTVIGSGTKFSRDNVLQSLLCLMLPGLPDVILSELFSDWVQSSNNDKFQRAICEYYFQYAVLASSSGRLLELKSVKRVVDRMNHSGEYTRRHVKMPSFTECPKGLYTQAVAERADPVEPATVQEKQRTFGTAPRERIDALLRTLYMSLETNREHLTWLGVCSTRAVSAFTHRVEVGDRAQLNTATSRFGLTPPDMHHPCTISDSAAMLDVCYAQWFLSSASFDEIYNAFEEALHVHVHVHVQPATSTPPTVTHKIKSHTSTFVDVITRSSRSILNTMAPQCIGCHCKYRLSPSDWPGAETWRSSMPTACHSCGSRYAHTGDHTGGTRELIACLLPVHALQLLDMFVCSSFC